MNERMNWSDVSTIVREDGVRAVSVWDSGSVNYPRKVEFADNSVDFYTEDGRCLPHNLRGDWNLRPNAKPKQQFEQVRMRNGEMATIYCWDAPADYPIHGRDHDGIARSWYVDGRYFNGEENDFDLMLDKPIPPDAPTIKARIIYRDFAGNETHRGERREYIVHAGKFYPVAQLESMLPLLPMQVEVVE